MLAKIHPAMRQLVRRSKVAVRKHLFLTVSICIGVYLITLQTAFLFTGDTWAESFAEYLSEAVRLSWHEVILPSWAGYLTIIPSFFSKAYISLGFPVGYVDFYFRAVTVLAAVLSVASVGLRFNRSVIKSDTLRVILAAFIILLLHDVSDFSFINIWYVCFVPLVMLGLNPKRIRWPAQLVYTLFGVAVALTKPSLVIAPFVIYRMIRTKEYISGGLILAATGLQTYLLLTAGPQIEAISFSLLEIAGALVIGAGVSLLKLVQIFPTNMWFIIGACWMLLLMAWALVRTRGFWAALTIIWGFLVAVYAQFMAPGEYLFMYASSFADFYGFGLKLQRDFLISIFLLIWIFLLLPHGYKFLKRRLPKHYLYGVVTLAVLLGGLFAVRTYQRIDAYRATDLSVFRNTLNVRQPVCIPLPAPMPGGFDVRWVYEEGGGYCVTPTGSAKPDPQTFTRPVDGQLLRVEGLENYPLQTLMIVVELPPGATGTITARDMRTGIPYAAPVHTRASGQSFVAFNVAGLPVQPSYTFRLSTEMRDAYLGLFAHVADGLDDPRAVHEAQLVHYAYFLQPFSALKK